MKEEFIGEIETYVDSMNSPRQVKKPTWRTKKLARRLTPFTAVLVAISMIGVGVLIYTLVQYDIQMSGNMELQGSSETSNILYDGARLTQAMTDITTMDFPSISHGQHLTATHTIQNLDGGTWDVTLDTSNMPLELVDEQDEWFGFQFYIHDSNGDNVTSFELAPSETKTLEFNYQLDDLFLETLNDFPFDLGITIALQVAPTLPSYDTEYRGIYLSQGSSPDTTFTLKDIGSGVVLTSAGDSETHTIAKPLGSSDFIYYDNSNTVIDYNNVNGIKYSKATSGEMMVQVVCVDENMRRGHNTDLSASLSSNFAGQDAMGLIWNGVSSTTFDAVMLYQSGLIQYKHFHDGTYTTLGTLTIGEITVNQYYTLRIVEVEGVSVSFYIDGSLVHTWTV